MDKQIRKIKVENKSKISDVTIIVFGLIFINLLSLILAVIWKGNYITIGFLILSLAFLVWRFSIIKYFMLESSGEVLSIKYYHPFVNKITPVLEVPLTKVTYSKIEKGFFSVFFRIHVRKGNDKKKNIFFYYHLQGFSTKQKQILKEFIEESLKY